MQAVTMASCPTCGAKLKGAPVCRRCKTDVSKALQTADQAERHYRLAAEAYDAGRFEAMLHHARRSFSLRRTPQSGRRLACAALLNGNHQLCLNIWAVSSPSAMLKLAGSHTGNYFKRYPKIGC